MRLLMSATVPKRILFAHNGSDRDTEILDALFQLNYGILPAEDLSAATEASSREEVDLVLASATGTVDGLALCDEIRGNTAKADLPIVLTSESADDASQLAEHREKATHANGYIQHSASVDEVIDWVERLIGLPPPPNGDATGSTREVQILQNRVEELQEQVHYYQGQANEVSQTGEKSVRDLTTVLNELQDDLDKVRQEKESLKDEVKLLKTDLGKNERDANARVKLLEDLKTEGDRRIGELSHEVEELRKTFSEAEKKHKRALGALREYYRGKMASVEKKLKDAKGEVERLSSELKKAQKLVDKAKSLFQ